jgi:hypothetical protein
VSDFRSASCPTLGNAEFGKLGRDRAPVRPRTHLLVDIENSTVEADVEGPARSKRLIFIDNTVCLRNALARIAEQRVVNAHGPREGLVDVCRIDTDGEIGHVERPNVVATLTE